MERDEGEEANDCDEGLVIVDHVAKVGFRYEDAFAFGFELILDGPERARPAG